MEDLEFATPSNVKAVSSAKGKATSSDKGKAASSAQSPSKVMSPSKSGENAQVANKLSTTINMAAEPTATAITSNNESFEVRKETETTANVASNKTFDAAEEATTATGNVSSNITFEVANEIANETSTTANVSGVNMTFEMAVEGATADVACNSTFEVAIKESTVDASSPKTNTGSDQPANNSNEIVTGQESDEQDNANTAHEQAEEEEPTPPRVVKGYNLDFLDAMPDPETAVPPGGGDSPAVSKGGYNLDFLDSLVDPELAVPPGLQVASKSNVENGLNKSSNDVTEKEDKVATEVVKEEEPVEAMEVDENVVANQIETIKSKITVKSPSKKKEALEMPPQKVEEQQVPESDCMEKIESSDVTRDVIGEEEEEVGPPSDNCPSVENSPQIALPPKRGYNLDFLDNLTDPELAVPPEMMMPPKKSAEAFPAVAGTETGFPAISPAAAAAMGQSSDFEMEGGARSSSPAVSSEYRNSSDEINSCEGVEKTVLSQQQMSESSLSSGDLPLGNDTVAATSTAANGGGGCNTDFPDEMSDLSSVVPPMPPPPQASGVIGVSKKRCVGGNAYNLDFLDQMGDLASAVPPPSGGDNRKAGVCMNQTFNGCDTKEDGGNKQVVPEEKESFVFSEGEFPSQQRRRETSSAGAAEKSMTPQDLPPLETVKTADMSRATGPEPAVLSADQDAAAVSASRSPPRSFRQTSLSSTGCDLTPTQATVVAGARSNDAGGDGPRMASPPSAAPEAASASSSLAAAAAAADPKTRELQRQAELLEKDRIIAQKHDAILRQQAEMEALKRQLVALDVNANETRICIDSSEKLIAELIADREKRRMMNGLDLDKLRSERMQAVDDLQLASAAMENVKRKFERLSDVCKVMSSNEQMLKGKVDDVEAKVKKSKNKFEALRKEADSKLRAATP